MARTKILTSLVRSETQAAAKDSRDLARKDDRFT